MSPTDREKILAILKANRSPAFLATVDGDQPQVRPVAAIIEDDLSVWVTTFCSSRKVKQIKANPKVSLSFCQHPDGNQTAVIIGEAEIVPDMDQKKRVWDLAYFDLTNYFPEGPGAKEYCLLKITAEKIEWWDSWETGTQTYEPGRP
jgi:general stress protein 26